MSVTINLTEAKAQCEAKRVAKLENDLLAYGGEHTDLTETAKQTERQAIIDASTTMQTNIANATDIATLQTHMDSMEA